MVLVMSSILSLVQKLGRAAVRSRPTLAHEASAALGVAGRD